MLGYGDFWGNLKILEIRGLKWAVFLMLFLHVLANVMCYLQCSWGVSHMFPCLLIVLNRTTPSPVFFWSRSMIFFKMCPTVPICSTHIPYDFHSATNQAIWKWWLFWQIYLHVYQLCSPCVCNRVPAKCYFWFFSQAFPAC